VKARVAVALLLAACSGTAAEIPRSTAPDAAAGSPPAEAGTTLDDAGLDAGLDASRPTVDPLAGLLGSKPAQSVVWVGAHPDDEAYAAPLLFELCKLRGAKCHFVVITDGGKGNCWLGAGMCGPSDDGGAPPGSMGAMRLGEMQKVADYFGGPLAALALEDTPSATVLGAMENWNQAYSGVPNDTKTDLISQKVVDAIAAAAPDVIVTFDPRHGVYCQPDHRAAGVLALYAADTLKLDLSRVLMIENTEIYRDATGALTQRAWVPDDPNVTVYDARSGTWHARADVASLHRSQYTAASIASYDLVRPEGRIVPVLPFSASLVDAGVSPEYAAICASEDAWFSGHGVCPKADGSTGPCW
jgi:LmbE family N-acetylglucosaminyl deacetylase